MSPTQAFFDRQLRLLEQLSVPRHRIGMNVLRVVAGCLILLQYLLNYSERRFLFGPNGMYPWDMFMSEHSIFSLYELSSNPIAFELIFHAGIVVTLAWVWGLQTRLLTPLTFLFWMSLRQVNP